VRGASGDLAAEDRAAAQVQSMHSRAPRHFCAPAEQVGLPSLACVGSGQAIGLPSLRASRKNRRRVVASP
jgi:hypothetical protein